MFTRPNWIEFIQNRYQAAQKAYEALMDLEKKRQEIINARTQLSGKTKSLEVTQNRNPDGWLFRTDRCESIPLYLGSNRVCGEEIRLNGNSLYRESSELSSNDSIDLGGHRYFIKILPTFYRNEGHQS